MSALLNTARKQNRFVVLPCPTGYKLYDRIEERFTERVHDTRRWAIWTAKRWNAAGEETE